MNEERHNVVANWSGNYPCLCIGTWTLTIDGKDYTDHIPREIVNEPMYTFGTYSKWYFDDEWQEEFEDYEDGLSSVDWIAANDEWLSTITDDYNLKSRIYFAFNENDFRYGSCGGCI